MKFGMPTMVDLKDITECACLAQEQGLDFIEINMSFPQYNYNNISVELLKELREKYGVEYTIHADELLNPFDFNIDVSECYFKVMKGTIKVAKALRMPVINMHLLKGVYTTLTDRVVYLNDEYEEEYLSSVRRFVRMCEEEIGDAPLKICIENVDSNPFTPFQIKALEIFLSSDSFGLTLDTGHYVALGRRDGEVFDKYRGKVLHMHLHDSDGKGAHLPLGTGIVGAEEAIKFVGSKATCLIEVKDPDGLRKSVNYLKNILKM